MNVLVKNFPETPKKAFVDLNVMELLTPEEFYIHIYLMNAEEDFAPTVRWISSFLDISIGKAQKISKSLRVKGFLDLMPTEDGRSYVWLVNSVPINYEKHIEFLKTDTQKLHQIRLERNKEIDEEIAILTKKIELGGDAVDLVRKIRRLEQEKK